MSAKDKQPVPGEILLTESEIADILGISIGSVRTHVHRGMQTLSRTLDGEASP